MLKNLGVCLILLVFVILPLSAAADKKQNPERCLPLEPNVIPVSREGRLIVYESDGMRCQMYVNTGGMAGGAGAPSCVSWPSAKDFRVIRIVDTTNK